MATEISPELERFVQEEISNGHFVDRGAVIEHALRLMQRDRAEAIEGIKAGSEDVAAGRVESLDEAISDIRSSTGISRLK